MMTKDKKGNYVFKKGGRYKVTTVFTPLWMPGISATCVETAPYEDVADRKGLFTIGDDSRYYVATDQFEEA